jgi:membrane-bound metal-dependent hydrolase YbcI (DUF457 family)
MMVGHAALAFALAAVLAHRFGLAPERALLFGVTAGAFAVVPDADMGYALVGVATADTIYLSGLLDAFWDAGLTVHRGMTHSLLVAGLAGIGFGLVAHRGAPRAAGVGVLAAMGLATVAFVGGLAAGVMTSFVLAGAVVAVYARRVGLGPREVLAGATIGLLSHPFGDVFTGTAPELLYPLDVRLLPTRVTLSGDPTLHLLGAFGLELATVWLALAVYLRLREQPIRAHVHRNAVLGAGYAAVVLALPAPTLTVSYHFVFTVLAVGTVGITADLPRPDLRSARSRHTVLLTGLAAVTIALFSYTVAYLLVGGVAPA